MRTLPEYLCLLAVGCAAAMTIAYLAGLKRKAFAFVVFNCLAGALTALLPMIWDVFLPPWAVMLCGALGFAGAFFYLL